LLFRLFLISANLSEQIDFAAHTIDFACVELPKCVRQQAYPRNRIGFCAAASGTSWGQRPLGGRNTAKQWLWAQVDIVDR
jgi:hypothetical protein